MSDLKKNYPIIFLFVFLFAQPAAPSFAEEESKELFRLIAHRGDSFSAPENTIAAVSRAIERGMTTIEVDVRQTLDSVLVVIHDGSVDRTTDGHGSVRGFLYRDLRRLDAGRWFGQSFSEEKVPTLEEIFHLVNGRALLVLDVKGDSSEYPGIEQRIVRQIRESYAAPWTAVQSLSDAVLRRVHRIDNTIRLIKVVVFDLPLLPLYVDHGLRWGRPAADLPLFAVQIHWFSARAGLVKKLQDRGILVWVWTVNSAKRMKKLVAKGVDGVTTDDPKLLSEW